MTLHQPRPALGPLLGQQAMPQTILTFTYFFLSYLEKGNKRELTQHITSHSHIKRHRAQSASSILATCRTSSGSDTGTSSATSDPDNMADTNVTDQKATEQSDETRTAFFYGTEPLTIFTISRQPR